MHESLKRDGSETGYRSGPWRPVPDVGRWANSVADHDSLWCVFCLGRIAEFPISADVDYRDDLEGNWRTKALAKLATFTKEIERDRARSERKTLERRGLICGRH
jgi:hypothetical protein